MIIGTDIFEDMKKLLGCEYISDIPRQREKVEGIMKSMDLAGYRNENISVFLDYVFSENRNPCRM